jgi:aldehyde:ferredoxin oxidoreductase
MDWYGYTGNILNVDLTNGQIFNTQLKEKDILQFIGGFGMNIKLFADRFNPKTDPFSPENFIIIGTGPLVGTMTPGASRTVVIPKFPATGAIANSCGSMSFGFHLKQSGYDHVIISGKAQEPIYLLIEDDHVELCESKEIWGKDIIEAADYLRKRLNPSGIIAIGQAGENLVKSSMTLIDKTSTLGRGGLGALFGSKNLKAIAVKGTRGISIAKPQEFNKIYEKFINRVRNYPHRDSWINLGMLRSLPVGMMISAKGHKKKARQCSERVYLKKIKERRIACPSCPMADKDILEIREGKYEGLINYTSSVINPFMMLMLENLHTYDEALKIFDLINRYGLDSLTVTSLFEFLNNLYQQGILTKEETGFEWKSDFNSTMELIEMIANRRGFGNILADGWNKLAELNEKIRDHMLVIKGLDVIFEPRFMRLGTMEFEQVVNPKGAHVASGGSPTYAGAAGSIEKFKTHFNRMGIPDSNMERMFSPPVKEMGVNVGRLTRYSEDWYTVLTSLGLCARAQMNRFYSLELVTNFYNVVTGFDLTINDLRLAAERSWNLLKLLNVKEGFSRRDDKFPKEWFKPLKYGENVLEFKDFFGETMITPKIANQLLDDYYDERGWDKNTGQPSAETVESLDLSKYL